MSESGEIIETGEAVAPENRRSERRDVDVEINVTANTDIDVNVDVDIWVPEPGSVPEPPGFDDGSRFITAEEQRAAEEAAAQEPPPPG